MEGQEGTGRDRQVVNINTASLEVLRDRVDGIGEVLAERIVAYREAHGPWSSVDELVRVPGIGPSSLAGFADQLTVAEAKVTSALPVAIEEPTVSRRASRAPSRAVEPPPVIELPESVGAARGAMLDDDDDEAAMPEIAAYLEDDDGLEELDLERDETELSLDPPAPVEASPETTAEASNDSGRTARAGGGVDAPSAPTSVEPDTVEATPAPKRRRWHDLLMVLLGGLLGVVLTLVVAILISGTLNFAPRKQVDALSRNVNTMQTNQELAWERIDEVTLKADELERRLTRVEPLIERVDQVEAQVGEAEKALGELDADVAQAQADLAALQEKVATEVAALDTRLTRTEDGLVALDTALGELETAFESVEERVKRFDAFFGALRDLLIDLEGAAPEVEAEG